MPLFRNGSQHKSVNELLKSSTIHDQTERQNEQQYKIGQSNSRDPNKQRKHKSVKHVNILNATHADPSF